MGCYVFRGPFRGRWEEEEADKTELQCKRAVRREELSNIKSRARSLFFALTFAPFQGFSAEQQRVVRRSRYYHNIMRGIQAFDDSSILLLIFLFVLVIYFSLIYLDICNTDAENHLANPGGEEQE